MLVRFRILTHKADPQAIADVSADWHQQREDSRVPSLLSSHQGPPPLDPAEGLFPSLEAPRAVEAEEGQRPLAEVQQMVRDGSLKPTDLVNLGKGWTTVGQCPALIDAVDAFEAARTPWGKLLLGLMAVGAVIAWLCTRA